VDDVVLLFRARFGTRLVDVAFLQTLGAMIAKLAVLILRAIAYMIWVSGLFGAAMLLLQGVAQLEGEGLAKVPETAEGVRGRLVIVAIFFAAGLCGCLIHQTIRFLSQGLRDFRSRLLRAAFDGSVFWAGTCLFFCLLILAASFQARWQVARSYYWVAGGAGVCLLVLLGTAELLHRRLSQATTRGNPAN
jgi:hypothetical protein